MRRIHRFLAASVLFGACSGDGGLSSGNFVGKDYPVVFAHGFNSSGWSDVILNALAADQVVASKSSVPGIDSVAVRARSLASHIDLVLQTTGAEKVHIVGHSMGGLDARYLVSQLGYAARVASITTICTPHRGTALADVGLGLVDVAGLDDAALNLLAQLFATDTQNPNLRVAAADLTESRAPSFNAQVPDMPGVYYQSYAGLSTVGGDLDPNEQASCGVLLLPEVRDHLRTLFVVTAAVVSEAGQEPHDGVVQVASARWGVFRGCLPADHADANDGGVDEDTGFSRLGFYRQLAGELVGRRAISR